MWNEEQNKSIWQDVHFQERWVTDAGQHYSTTDKPFWFNIYCLKTGRGRELGAKISSTFKQHSPGGPAGVTD